MYGLTLTYLSSVCSQSSTAIIERTSTLYKRLFYLNEKYCKQNEKNLAKSSLLLPMVNGSSDKPQLASHFTLFLHILSIQNSVVGKDAELHNLFAMANDIEIIFQCHTAALKYYLRAAVWHDMSTTTTDRSG